MGRRKNPRQWDKPGMARALADPVNRRPLTFDDAPRDNVFDPDERQHIDRSQNRELRRLLIGDPESGILEGSRVYKEPDLPDPSEEDDDA